MGQLTLPARGLICLDASAVIYSVEKIQPYHGLLRPVWQYARAGSIQLAGSELLLIETLVKPVQQGDQLLETTFRQVLTASREVRLLPISLAVLEQALRLRAAHGLKTPDAIHAATALLAGCALFIANDPAFRRVPGLSAAILDDFIQ